MPPKPIKPRTTINSTKASSSTDTNLAELFRAMPDMIQRLVEQQTELVSKIEHLTTQVAELEDTIDTLNNKISSKDESAMIVPSAACSKCNCTSAPATDTATVEQCTDSTPASSPLTQEVAEILMKEKKKEALKEECRAIKSDIILDWDSNIKSRNKFFRNFVKNDRKSDLYDNWAENSPNYIPFKHRPKRIPGERSEHCSARIEEAKRRYTAERELLKSYAQTHQHKVDQIDSQMADLFLLKCGNDDQYTMLIEQWAKETRRDEQRAQQMWSRNEKFLLMKKHEDEQHGNGALVDITWGEKLRSYGKKKPRPRFTLQPSSKSHPLHYSTLPPAPWQQ